MITNYLVPFYGEHKHHLLVHYDTHINLFAIAAVFIKFWVESFTELTVLVSEIDWQTHTEHAPRATLIITCKRYITHYKHIVCYFLDLYMDIYI